MSTVGRVNARAKMPNPCFCYYCGCQIFANSNGKARPHATKDHILPKARFKAQHTSATVWSCYECNIDKAALTIEEYRVVLAFRYGRIQTDYKFQGEELKDQRSEESIGTRPSVLVKYY